MEQEAIRLLYMNEQESILISLDYLGPGGPHPQPRKGDD